MGTHLWGKECVAVKIGLYKHNGAFSYVGFDFLSDCSLHITAAAQNHKTIFTGISGKAKGTTHKVKVQYHANY